MIITPENKGPLEDMRWLAWRNDSSETCPAGGLVRVTGSVINGRQLVRLGNKPNADSQAGLYVNSFFPVAAGAYGRLTRESPCIVAYTGSTPTNGQVWGAASASWYLTTGKRGWLIDGAASDGRVPVQRVESGVSSGTTVPTTTYAISAYNSEAETITSVAHLEFDTIVGGTSNLASLEPTTGVFELLVDSPIRIATIIKMQKVGTQSQQTSVVCALHYDDGGGDVIVDQFQIGWGFVTGWAGDETRTVTLRHMAEAVTGDSFWVTVDKVSGPDDQIDYLGADGSPSPDPAIACWMDAWSLNNLAVT